jgi:sigma-B regulation protein RsbU (phosphoserine phosphatase)
MSEAPAPTPPTVPADAIESLDSTILRVLMDNIPDRIYFKDLNSRFVRNNIAQARSLGAASPEECVGKSDFDFFSKEHAERAYLDEQVIIRTGRPIIAKIERTTLRDGTQTWVSTTKMPWVDMTGRIIGTFGLTRNITALKEAEEKLTIERNLLRTIIDHLPSRIYVKDLDSRYVLNNQAHLKILGLEHQEDAIGRTTIDFFPGERGEQAMADDRRVLAGNMIQNQEKSNFGAEGEVRWSLTTKVPLHDLRGQLMGLVGISHDITRRKLAEIELERRTQEMEADVQMARQIQESFLPRNYPVFPRGVPIEASALRFAHHYIPATTLGGDFFHLQQLTDAKCGVLVCDVMGHGVRAGLITALIRGVIEELDERAKDPAKVLAEINHTLTPILEKTGQPMFATAFFGVIDIVTQTLTYANAGHPPPFVLRRDERTVLRLATDDPEPAAGLVENFTYTKNTCPFAVGDALLGFTDGLFEAANAESQQFGEERLRSLVTAQIDQTGAALLDRVVGEIQAFSGHATFEDDLCMVIVESPRGVGLDRA